MAANYRLKAARVLKGLTQLQLAETCRSGITGKAVAK